MHETYLLHGVLFTWDGRKARTNDAKHGITFKAAAEAFLDPFLRVVDASRQEESRDAIIGCDAVERLLFVVHAELLEDRIRIISARRASREERKTYENG